MIRGLIDHLTIKKEGQQHEENPILSTRAFAGYLYGLWLLHVVLEELSYNENKWMQI